ncbi:MAG: ammonia-forming cytochrome c nitrite reductase subunit c552 [Deltaproteobacteria bacterium]|nr:ammonia-forming cytochrome c nitrite reductase subunit c552 [Deltaproteobacteria bacterium]
MAGFVVMLLLVVVMFEVTSSPEFCGSCHNMRPYIESWKASSHNEVNCATCHYEPGFMNYVKGKFTDGQAHLVIFITGKNRGRYHAEISNASCLQCHDRESLNTPKEFKGVTFSHSNHLDNLRRNKKLRCVTCHGQLVQGEHLTVDERDCFICHFKADEKAQRDPVLSNCRTCHLEVPLEIQVDGHTFHHGRYLEDGTDCTSCHVGIVQGQGAVNFDRCVECHSEKERALKELIAEKFTSETYHLNHVTNHKVECWRCHEMIEHEMVRNPTSIDFGRNCTVCHTDEQHLGPREMYRGTGGVGVPDMPSKMFMANVDCASCHVKEGVGQYGSHATDVAFLTMGAACNACHGEGYDGMLHRWQKILHDAETAASGRLLEAEKALFDAQKSGHSNEAYQQAVKLVGDAGHNIKFVRVGKGHHNMEYALKLLQTAQAMTEEAMGLLNNTYAKQPVEPVEMTCTNLCHSEMETRKVRLGSVNYPHKTHIVDLGFSCTDCHGGMDEHGKSNFTMCGECHHGEGQGKVGCADCHQDVAGIIAGDAGYGAAKTPAPMKDLDCTNCHTQIAAGQSTTDDVIVATCVECHEAGYDKKVGEWMDEIQKSLAAQRDKAALFRKTIAERKAMGMNMTKLGNVLLRLERNNELIGGKNGQHNIDYARELLAANAKLIEKGEMLMRDYAKEMGS